VQTLNLPHYKLKFVIFPGGSDPYNPKYKSVYDLIKDEAKNRGFDEVLLPSYPGHQSYAPQGELTLKGACQEMGQSSHLGKTLTMEESCQSSSVFEEGTFLSHSLDHVSPAPAALPLRPFLIAD